MMWAQAMSDRGGVSSGGVSSAVSADSLKIAGDMQLRVTEAVHLLVADVVKPGDVVIDATAGNGHDTAFLADRVGEEGHVFAFDVQSEALQSTAERLQGRGLLERVDLVRASHERMADYVDPDGPGIGAVMFNLGYLPGGADRTTMTRPITTTAAIDASLNMLRPGGIVSVVCYRGHEGGIEESEAVMSLAEALDLKRFRVSTYRMESAADAAPIAVFIQNRP